MRKLYFLLLLSTFNSIGQSITRTFPIEVSHIQYSVGFSAPIVQTPDNGYLLNYSYSYPNWDAFPGYKTSIIKTDANFIPIWTKTTGIGMGNGKKTIVLNDGSYLIFFDSGTLLKLNAAGQTLFSIGNLVAYPNRLNIADAELIGNTIKVVGDIDVYNGFGYITSTTQVMIDFDTNGNILQSFVLNVGGSSPWPQATNICKDNLGNYYVTGYSYADGNYICKFNSGNTLLWSRRYDYGGHGVSISDMMILNNGDLLLVGSIGSVFLYRLSSETGIAISAKTADTNYSYINTISQLPNGDLVATGTFRQNADSFLRTFSMRMDSNEVFSWLKLYNYGFGISAPFVKNDTNWYYSAFHNNNESNNYPILFNTESNGVTSCPYTNISINLIDTFLNSSPITVMVTPGLSFETPSTVTNFYPTETQAYQDACFSLLDANEIDPRGNLIVYPNPSKGEVHIAEGSAIKSIEIWNVLGQKIKNFYPNQLEASILIEGSGMYVLRIETERGIKTAKVSISN